MWYIYIYIMYVYIYIYHRSLVYDANFLLVFPSLCYTDVTMFRIPSNASCLPWGWFFGFVGFEFETCFDLLFLGSSAPFNLFVSFVTQKEVHAHVQLFNLDRLRKSVTANGQSKFDKTQCGCKGDDCSDLDWNDWNDRTYQGIPSSCEPDWET